MSRYFRATQNNGKGYMIIALDAADPTKGTIVEVNLTAEQADVKLRDLRASETRAQA